MQGLEFIVIHDPSENDTKPEHSGVWVIRKQNRRKRQGVPDEITGISSYYVVGENVYMAPSVGSILGSRLVRALVPLFPGDADLKLLALDRHLPYSATLHSVFPSHFHPFAWPHLPPPCIEEPNTGVKPSANPDEQRGSTAAVRRHTFTSATRYCYRHESPQRLGYEPPRHPNARIFLPSIQRIRIRLHG